MNQNELKQSAAAAALDYIRPRLETDSVLGIGTGSTTNYFIDLLASEKNNFDAAVASSDASAERLKNTGISVCELNSVTAVDFYIDGADEVNHHLQLIKGGGGALTREKIVRATASHFVCIADESKLVDILGAFPLPVEVIPMARSYVARELVKLGGDPVYRQGISSDNGNVILDVFNLNIMEPLKLETSINLIAGVVSNGLFAHRPADTVMLGTQQGIKTLRAS